MYRNIKITNACMSFFFIFYFREMFLSGHTVFYLVSAAVEYTIQTWTSGFDPLSVTLYSLSVHDRIENQIKLHVINYSFIGVIFLAISFLYLFFMESFRLVPYLTIFMEDFRFTPYSTPFMKGFRFAPYLSNFMEVFTFVPYHSTFMEGFRFAPYPYDLWKVSDLLPVPIVLDLPPYLSDTNSWFSN